MQNVIDNAPATAAATLATAGDATAADSKKKGKKARKSDATAEAGGVAVLEAPAAGTEAEDAGPTPPPASADPLAEVLGMIGANGQVEYTRQHLVDARTFVLLAKRSAKHGGFGEKFGPMIRNTLGYKFDGMDVMDMLKEMAKPDFLDRYKATCERWYGGLNKSASAATLKGNQAKYEAAIALVTDRPAYARLVKSLLVLCSRNQSWMEAGTNLALPYNGHKALLDLFGVTVTNSRRLSLTAN